MNEIVVSKESFFNIDKYALIISNIEFLNALFEVYLTSNEVSQDGLRSYYVDYYLVQMKNGGFSQFVYNSKWNEDVIDYVRTGLAAMGATENLALFEKLSNQLDNLELSQLQTFLNSDYWGESLERDLISSFDDDFFALQESENLIYFNHHWLLNHKNLVVLEEEEWDERIKMAKNANKEFESRQKAALDAQPRYANLIRKLCEAANQELEKITAGDPSHKYNGQQILAWHFITDQGHHFMVELVDEVIMFNSKTNNVVAQIRVGSSL
ncbi:MAG: hypothetical protein AAF490_13540 [Chloroflexota bacterium]